MGREHGTKIEELVGLESFRMPKNSKKIVSRRALLILKTIISKF
jgi:hypothetical protein